MGWQHYKKNSMLLDAVLMRQNLPLRDWRMAMSRFIIEFGDRLDGHL
ncbi:hypothetical protein ACSN7O_004784 [Enterobacter chuandaensis]